MNTTYEFTVGRLLCGQIRDFLKQIQFTHGNIDWIESKGWIERTFIIKGNADTIKLIAERLKIWSEALGETGE